MNSEDLIASLQITAEDLRPIRKLKNSAIPGPDNVPNLFIKRCWSVLEKPIPCIFNKMLSRSYFPTEWKFLYIFPDFKSGNKHNVSYYRPISHISCIPKIFYAYLTTVLTSNYFLQLLIVSTASYLVGRP